MIYDDTVCSSVRHIFAHDGKECAFPLNSKNIYMNIRICSDSHRVSIL